MSSPKKDLERATASSANGSPCGRSFRSSRVRESLKEGVEDPQVGRHEEQKQIAIIGLGLIHDNMTAITAPLFLPALFRSPLIPGSPMGIKTCTNSHSATARIVSSFFWAPPRPQPSTTNLASCSAAQLASYRSMCLNRTPFLRSAKATTIEALPSEHRPSKVQASLI